MDIARIQDVLVDKFSMAQIVFVKLDIIGMEVFVYCVLMDKSGIHQEGLAHAKKDLVGMEISVKRESLVQGEESIIKIMNNAYALTSIFGMELHACLNQIAVVVNAGMKRRWCVNALKVSTMMEEHACFVLQGKLGTKELNLVFALQELNGITNFAL